MTRPLAALPGLVDGPTDAELLRQREALRRVVEEISSELELRPLLTRIVRHACELLDAHDGTIGLYDSGKDVIRSEAVYRMPPGELGAEVARGIGLAGQVLARCAPVVARRYGDLPSPPLPELAENSVLGVPIFWRGALIGFFGIGAAPNRHFGDADVEILTLFARHAAVAIHNARRFGEEKRRTERLAMLARTAHSVASGLDLESMLETAATAIHELLGYPCVAIPLTDPDDPSVLVIRVVGGAYRHLRGREFRLPIHRGIMGAAVRERRTQLVLDVESDPRWVPTPGAQGIRAELAVPILLGDRVLGVLNVESPDALSAEDATALEIVADQLAVAIQNTILHRRARRLAVVEERQRLAHELHDAISQLLFSSTLIAESVVGAYRADAAEGERRVERLVELNRLALAEIRQLMSELSPEVGEQPGAAAVAAAGASSTRIRRAGLAAVLRDHLGALHLPGISTSLDADEWKPQSPAVEIALFRIAQEAVHNAVKHAAAGRVHVRLARAGGALELHVTDDGRGFDAESALARAIEQPSPGCGLGLLSMRQRALALDGSFHLASTLGRGTQVTITVPGVDWRAP